VSIKIIFSNQKGGVGKTTTAFNIAHGLTKFYNLRVLMIDCDPQSLLTALYGIDINTNYPNLYDLMCEDSSIPIQKSILNKIIFREKKGPHLIPASIVMCSTDINLGSKVGREFILTDKLDNEIINMDYDVIVIDTAPALNLCTLNAFVYGDIILVPTPVDKLNIIGFKELTKIVTEIKKRMNPDLYIGGVIVTRFVERFIISRESITSLKDVLGNKLMNTKIKQTVKINEFPSFNTSIFDYDKDCQASKDYHNLTKEIYEKFIHEC